MDAATSVAERQAAKINILLTYASFFTPQKNISSAKIKILEQHTIHHLKDVLMLKPEKRGYDF